jgi:hypothetical protein
MLRSSGLVVRERPVHEVYVCEPDATESQLIAEMRRDELRAALGSR